jgi:isopenicillin-N N-acyltransferase-like protein
MEFIPLLLDHPQYMQEIQGITDGSGNNLGTIIALNVRTEISFGLMKDDGCTALAWKTGEKSFLAQNWDWQVEQKENLVLLDILPSNGSPKIKMMTEAGIIGKIGINSEGVGVCLNAIRAKGMDVNRMPVHLGLRMCLESKTREEAVRKLKEVGIASACTIVIADKTGGVALECSSVGFKEIEMDDKGKVFHSNHYLKKQEGVFDTQYPKDTLDRIKRIKHLADGVKGEVTLEKVADIFKDEHGLPTSICRAKGGASKGATLFNIVSDLSLKRALVTLGRPTEPEEKFWLDFTPN